MNGFIVLDVSACLTLLLGKEGADLFAEALRQDKIVIAPELFIPELTNTCWKINKCGNLRIAQSRKLLQEGLGLVDSFFPSSVLYEEAFELSTSNGHSSSDCFYLSLQIKMKAELLTADKKLATLARSLSLPAIGG